MKTILFSILTLSLFASCGILSSLTGEEFKMYDRELLVENIRNQFVSAGMSEEEVNAHLMQLETKLDTTELAFKDLSHEVEQLVSKYIVYRIGGGK